MNNIISFTSNLLLILGLAVVVTCLLPWSLPIVWLAAKVWIKS